MSCKLHACAYHTHQNNRKLTLTKKKKKEMRHLGGKTKVKSHKRKAHTRKISPTKTTKVKKSRVKSHKRRKPK